MWQAASGTRNPGEARPWSNVDNDAEPPTASVYSTRQVLKDLRVKMESLPPEAKAVYSKNLLTLALNAVDLSQLADALSASKIAAGVVSTKRNDVVASTIGAGNATVPSAVNDESGQLSAAVLAANDENIDEDDAGVQQRAVEALTRMQEEMDAVREILVDLAPDNLPAEELSQDMVGSIASSVQDLSTVIGDYGSDDVLARNAEVTNVSLSALTGRASVAMAQASRWDFSGTDVPTFGFGGDPEGPKPVAWPEGAVDPAAHCIRLIHPEQQPRRTADIDAENMAATFVWGGDVPIGLSPTNKVAGTGTAFNMVTRLEENELKDGIVLGSKKRRLNKEQYAADFVNHMMGEFDVDNDAALEGEMISAHNITVAESRTYAVVHTFVASNASYRMLTEAEVGPGFSPERILTPTFMSQSVRTLGASVLTKAKAMREANVFPTFYLSVEAAMTELTGLAWLLYALAVGDLRISIKSLFDKLGTVSSVAVSSLKNYIYVVLTNLHAMEYFSYARDGEEISDVPLMLSASELPAVGTSYPSDMFNRALRRYGNAVVRRGIIGSAIRAAQGLMTAAANEVRLIPERAHDRIAAVEAHLVEADNPFDFLLDEAVSTALFAQEVSTSGIKSVVDALVPTLASDMKKKGIALVRDFVTDIAHDPLGAYHNLIQQVPKALEGVLDDTTLQTVMSFLIDTGTFVTQFNYMPQLRDSKYNGGGRTVTDPVSVGLADASPLEKATGEYYHQFLLDEHAFVSPDIPKPDAVTASKSVVESLMGRTRVIANSDIPSVNTFATYMPQALSNSRAALSHLAQEKFEGHDRTQVVASDLVRPTVGAPHASHEVHRQLRPDKYMARVAHAPAATYPVESTSDATTAHRLILFPEMRTLTAEEVIGEMRRDGYCPPDANNYVTHPPTTLSQDWTVDVPNIVVFAVGNPAVIASDPTAADPYASYRGSVPINPNLSMGTGYGYYDYVLSMTQRNPTSPGNRIIHVNPNDGSEGFAVLNHVIDVPEQLQNADPHTCIVTVTKTIGAIRGLGERYAATDVLHNEYFYGLSGWFLPLPSTANTGDWSVPVPSLAAYPFNPPVSGYTRVGLTGRLLAAISGGRAVATHAEQQAGLTWMQHMAIDYKNNTLPYSGYFATVAEGLGVGATVPTPYAYTYDGTNVHNPGMLWHGWKAYNKTVHEDGSVTYGPGIRNGDGTKNMYPFMAHASPHEESLAAHLTVRVDPGVRDANGVVHNLGGNAVRTTTPPYELLPEESTPYGIDSLASLYIAGRPADVTDDATVATDAVPTWMSGGYMRKTITGVRFVPRTPREGETPVLITTVLATKIGPQETANDSVDPTTKRDLFGMVNVELSVLPAVKGILEDGNVPQPLRPTASVPVAGQTTVSYNTKTGSSSVVEAAEQEPIYRAPGAFTTMYEYTEPNGDIVHANLTPTAVLQDNTSMFTDLYAQYGVPETALRSAGGAAFASVANKMPGTNAITELQIGPEVPPETFNTPTGCYLEGEFDVKAPVLISDAAIAASNDQSYTKSVAVQSPAMLQLFATGPASVAHSMVSSLTLAYVGGHGATTNHFRTGMRAEDVQPPGARSEYRTPISCVRLLSEVDSIPGIYSDYTSLTKRTAATLCMQDHVVAIGTEVRQGGPAPVGLGPPVAGETYAYASHIASANGTTYRSMAEIHAEVQVRRRPPQKQDTISLQLANTSGGATTDITCDIRDSDSVAVAGYATRTTGTFEADGQVTLHFFKPWPHDDLAASIDTVTESNVAGSEVAMIGRSYVYVRLWRVYNPNDVQVVATQYIWINNWAFDMVVEMVLNLTTEFPDRYVYFLDFNFNLATALANTAVLPVAIMA